MKARSNDRLDQRYLDEATIRVTDPDIVKQYLKRGKCRKNTYEALIRITAETGALIIPFREHPKVKEVLESG